MYFCELFEASCKVSYYIFVAVRFQPGNLFGNIHRSMVAGLGATVYQEVGDLSVWFLLWNPAELLTICLSCEILKSNSLGFWSLPGRIFRKIFKFLQERVVSECERKVYIFVLLPDRSNLPVGQRNKFT